MPHLQVYEVSGFKGASHPEGATSTFGGRKPLPLSFTKYAECEDAVLTGGKLRELLCKFPRAPGARLDDYKKHQSPNMELVLNRGLFKESVKVSPIVMGSVILL